MSKAIDNSLLGRETAYVDRYAPELLYPVPRREARAELGIAEEPLPFTGLDRWHGYELSWLDARGKPVVAMATFSVPCDSPNIIESKSFKLYLNSFANSRLAGRDEVRDVLVRDLSACAGAPVAVTLQTLDEAEAEPRLRPAGECLDDVDVEVEDFVYEPALLRTVDGAPGRQEFYSHLLRSRCPVTGQPDWATVILRLDGPPVDRAGLLRYLVGLRNHQGFHEQIVERIFLDVQARCAPTGLTVYGRFTRRGGLDINPFRSNFEAAPASLRTVRQ